jgi:CheY-like chemotaxis protein
MAAPGPPKEGEAWGTTQTVAPPSCEATWASPGSRPIPSRLEGGYRIERSLGRGAMGQVVLALDERLEREVAIKFIRAEHVGRPGAWEQFLREARAMARVRDPHVVEIYALGGVDVPYIIMEYVPGPTLEARLAGQDSLSLEEALDVMDQICRGVEAIHASGAVHRDLKPSNILLGPGGRVVVADLGLALRVTSASPDDVPEIAGTPAYIAPEVIARQPVPVSQVGRTDVYALGVIAYLLFTGQLPFEARDVEVLLKMHLHTTPTPLRQHRPGLPGSIEAVVMQALQKEPDARLASAGDLRRALQGARESMSATFEGVRVLVADDEPTAARLVAAALSEGLPGAVIETAMDGEQALAAIDARMPSLVVADLHMPRLSGFELLASLRGDERTRSIPVVVVTATGNGRDWKLMQQLEAEGFLSKPLDLDALLSLVRALLSRERPSCSASR